MFGRRSAVVAVLAALSGLVAAPLGVARADGDGRAEAARPPGAEPLREHATAVASYLMRATLDPTKHEIVGRGTIVWRNASRVGQKELFVHLYLNAFKNERSVFLRTPVGGFRGGGGVYDWGYVQVERFALRGGSDLWRTATRADPDEREDETDMRVELPNEIPPGGSITVDVEWRVHLPNVVARAGYAGTFHMAAQWFPKLARLEPDGRWAHFPYERLSEFYADFGSYDVTIDAPRGYIVGATGALTGRVEAGDRVEHRFVQADVHDFAFTAWDRFREASAEVDGVAIRCLYPAGFEAAVRDELAAASFGLRYLGAAYGRYPYKTLTLVHPPGGAEDAAGMEYPTLITTGGGWYMPLTGVRLAEIVTIHELGHQWFYGLVATNEHDHPFLDEGVNSFAEVDAMEAYLPRSSLWGRFGLSLGLPGAYRYGSSGYSQNAVVAQAAPRFQTGSDYGGLVYYRTSTLLTTLARVYGADVVRGAIGRYAREHRFGHPSPDDFLRAIADGVGVEAAAAARAILFDHGWVDYSVDEIESRPVSAPQGVFGDPSHPSERPSAAGEGWVGSVLVRRRGNVALPVEVELRAEDGSVQRVAWAASQEVERVPYAGSSPLVGAAVDPDRRVLLDDNLMNNAASRERRKIGDTVFDWATYLAELVLLGLAP